VTEHSPNGLKMYVPKDGIIYRKEVYQLCAVQPADGPAQHSPLRVDDDGGDTDDHDGDTDGLESSTDSMRHSHGNPGVPSAIEAGDDPSSHAELMSSAESECESLDENFSTSSDHHHQPRSLCAGHNLCVADSLSLSLSPRRGRTDVASSHHFGAGEAWDPMPQPDLHSHSQGLLLLPPMPGRHRRQAPLLLLLCGLSGYPCFTLLSYLLSFSFSFVLSRHSFSFCLCYLFSPSSRWLTWLSHTDNKVLYMDPHFVQPTVKMDDDPLFPIEVHYLPPTFLNNNNNKLFNK